MSDLMRPQVLRAVQARQPLALEAGCSLPQFALAWVLREPNVGSAIIGASRPEQLDETVAASEKTIDLQLFSQADRSWQQHSKTRALQGGASGRIEHRQRAAALP